MMKRRRNRVNSQPPPKDVAAALYNTFYASTFRQVLAVIGDEDLAIEATQEAFVRAFEQFGTLRNQDKFSSWVVTIALNVARDKARKKSREIAVDPHIFPPLADLAAGRTAEETALARDTTQSLIEAFRSLPEELKEVTLLFYVQDLGIAEIARQLNLPDGTVKSRLFRARKKLRETLEPDA
ncbi:MAG: RNA polymerase sigma factor [Armatimonadetes bacterium]|nr:RNA polymerase sigma factor [Armatimonadota bacterium]